MSILRPNQGLTMRQSYSLFESCLLYWRFCGPLTGARGKEGRVFLGTLSSVPLCVCTHSSTTTQLMHMSLTNLIDRYIHSLDSNAPSGYSVL